MKQFPTESAKRIGDSDSGRRGVVAPLMAVALLVVLSGMALVLDRLWLQTAQWELSTCAEAVALASARELASDDLLRGEGPADRRIGRARKAAVRMARRNLVAGAPVELDSSEGGDLRFGRLVRNDRTGLVHFLETEFEPTSVAVTAFRNRGRNNPVALLLAELTGQSYGDVAAAAEASLDNRLVGLRPTASISIPALPMAILERDPTGEREDTWEMQIRQRCGEDRFGFDAESGRVTRGSDGIPEIVLRSMPVRGEASEANVQMVDVGTGCRRDGLVRQVRGGWTLSDWQTCGEGAFLTNPAVRVNASGVIADDLPSALEEMIGQCRICLLYDEHRPVGKWGNGTVRVTGLIAGRVMAVRRGKGRVCEIVFQPGVLTTRTAVLASEVPGEPGHGMGNPYIYKLQLTN